MYNRPEDARWCGVVLESCCRTLSGSSYGLPCGRSAVLRMTMAGAGSVVGVSTRSLLLIGLGPVGHVSSDVYWELLTGSGSGGMEDPGRGRARDDRLWGGQIFSKLPGSRRLERAQAVLRLREAQPSTEEMAKNGWMEPAGDDVGRAQPDRASVIFSVTLAGAGPSGVGTPPLPHSLTAGSQSPVVLWKFNGHPAFRSRSSMHCLRSSDLASPPMSMEIADGPASSKRCVAQPFSCFQLVFFLLPCIPWCLAAVYRRSVRGVC